MNILLSGSTGFIGTALSRRLMADGHTVIPLVRGKAVTGSRNSVPAARWDIGAGTIDLSQALPLDAVIHLAGEGVASGIWTRAKMERIRESRTRGTTLLSRTIAALNPRPKVFLSASAVGFYGNQGDTIVDELSRCGDGFLAKVCAAWEESTAAATDVGIRVVNPRFGLVLDRSGGLLGKVLLPFKLGLGGRLGDGNQYMSWISLHDALEALCLCLNQSVISGPVNFVSPNPVTNREWTKTLANVLHRPALIPVPRLVLSFILGRMADEALLASSRVKPLRLEQLDFTFRHRELAPTLAELLQPS